MKEKTRIYALDVARSFAIFCVVICHVTENIFSIDQVSLNAMGYPAKALPVVLMTIGTLGVPIFLYLTGFLLLSKTYDAAAASRFYRTRFFQLVTVSMVWTVLWRLFRLMISGGTLSPLMIWKDLLYASGPVFPQIWYMPMILGLYLLIPFLANALHASETKWIGLVLAAGVAFAFVLPLWNAICECLGIPALYSDFHYKMHTSFFLVYPVAAHLLRRKPNIQKLPRMLPALVAAVSFAAIIAVQLCLLDREFGEWIESVHYNDPILLVCTFALFLLLLRISGEKTPEAMKRMFSSVSRCSFGIYLIHYTIIDAAAPWIQNRFSALPAYLLLTAITFGGSWLFVRLLSFHPLTRRYLFFIH